MSLKDVLSPSIIHQVSAIAAHVMLEGEGVKGRYQERQREEDGNGGALTPRSDRFYFV